MHEPWMHRPALSHSHESCMGTPFARTLCLQSHSHRSNALWLFLWWRPVVTLRYRDRCTCSGSPCSRSLNRQNRTDITHAFEFVVLIPSLHTFTAIFCRLARTRLACPLACSQSRTMGRHTGRFSTFSRPRQLSLKARSAREENYSQHRCRMDLPLTCCCGSWPQFEG